MAPHELVGLLEAYDLSRSATVQILQQRNDELETENEKLKKRKGKGMSASKPHWGGTSAHNEEFSHVRCWGGLLSARGKSCVSVSHSLT